jgi:hypothetical protein
MSNSEMPTKIPIRILSVGRHLKTADQLHIDNAGQGLPELQGQILNGDGNVAYHFEFQAVSNQRAALAELSDNPPHIVLVEIDNKPNSRARFCDMIRYRLPSVAIVAVGKEAPQGDFVFDAFLAIPLDGNKAQRLFYKIFDGFKGYQLQQGEILLNTAKRTVKSPRGRYRMTPKQCMLLHLLMSRVGEVVERQEIMHQVWNTSFMDDTRTLDVHVRWLREAIESDPSAPRYLITVRGVGYRFELPD